MLKNKRIKRVFQAIAVLLIAWFAIGLTDYCCVINEKRPIFCIELSGGYYYGLGYSFYTCQHPLTEKIEYAYYIFGTEVKCNITNSAIPIE